MSATQLQGPARSLIDARIPTMRLLERFGPGAPPEQPPITPSQSIAYCRELATSHYENFSVLSRLVPERLRDDFAAVYAFCRWSDDLADETGASVEDRARSIELLNWWRGGLTRCFDDDPSAIADIHPVYIALRQTRRRHQALIAKPFHDLIDAFVQDQHVVHYKTWDQCVDYCTRSANPVGRIVLALGGYAESDQNADLFRMSDATCTALQLINFWQDVRRDLLERDRVYLPFIDTGLDPDTLRSWLGKSADPKARVAYIRAVRPLVDRTAELFAAGAPLPTMLNAELGPVVWLFGAGGEAILKAVQAIGCATLWERPRLTTWTKGLLLAQAWARRRTRGGRRPVDASSVLTRSRV